MIVFDYLYYLIYKFYSSYNEKGAESTSAGIIGGFQALNVLTIIMVISAYVKNKTYINKLLIIVLFIIFQVFTYRRYIYKENNSLAGIEQKWLSKSHLLRQWLKIILLIYGIVSIGSCFGLAIYLGNRK